MKRSVKLWDHCDALLYPLLIITNFPSAGQRTTSQTHGIRPRTNKTRDLTMHTSTEDRSRTEAQENTAITSVKLTKFDLVFSISGPYLRLCKSSRYQTDEKHSVFWTSDPVKKGNQQSFTLTKQTVSS